MSTWLKRTTNKQCVHLKVLLEAHRSLTNREAHLCIVWLTSGVDLS